jgi:hypothetical protein
MRNASHRSDCNKDVFATNLEAQTVMTLVWKLLLLFRHKCIFIPLRR